MGRCQPLVFSGRHGSSQASGPDAMASKEAELWEQQRCWIQETLDRKFREQEKVFLELVNKLVQEEDIEEVHSASFTTLAEWQVQKPPSIQPKDAAPKKPLPRGATGLAKSLMSEISHPEPPVIAFVKGPLDVYMGIVVCIHLAFMIAMAQLTGDTLDNDLGITSEAPTWSPEIFDIVEVVFFCIYVVDVLVRVVILRTEWAYDHFEGLMFMNLFDAILVLVSAAELFILPVLSDGREGTSRSIRVIKLIRITRTLRVVKTVGIFRQLRVLVRSCVASVGALGWSMVLLLLLKLGFALAICQALQGYIADQSADLETRLEMNRFYGSFVKALYTMFEVTHSGSWPLRVRPVVEKVSPWYALLFLSYITLVVFAVIRIVTALFLKETLASAANDADIAIEGQGREAKSFQRKLEELFRAADEDGNGALSADEFLEAMNLPSVQQYLNYLDIRVQDIGPLFDILDDGDGLITIAEFSKGLMQIKGQARALDMVVLHHENAKLLKEVQAVRREVSGRKPQARFTCIQTTI
ncbi:unnamed protein product [Effrenium voratum]|uniref:EF-hand domain-containing protein n=1 Tax=Effrenium voratum TaxID=2562239 RepID=A0AA36IY02_9DINO|nr:unnamed protein product [Effrenium voratum]